MRDTSEGNKASSVLTQPKNRVIPMASTKTLGPTNPKYNCNKDNSTMQASNTPRMARFSATMTSGTMMATDNNTVGKYTFHCST